MANKKVRRYRLSETEINAMRYPWLSVHKCLIGAGFDLMSPMRFWIEMPWRVWVYEQEIEDGS